VAKKSALIPVVRTGSADLVSLGMSDELRVRVDVSNLSAYAKISGCAELDHFIGKRYAPCRTGPGQAGKFAVLLDARWTGVALSSAERASPGLGWRGDHPRPADPVAEVSDLPTIGDLAGSCR
jgi:hypothetical protein